MRKLEKLGAQSKDEILWQIEQIEDVLDSLQEAIINDEDNAVTRNYSTVLIALVTELRDDICMT